MEKDYNSIKADSSPTKTSFGRSLLGKRINHKFVKKEGYVLQDEESKEINKFIRKLEGKNKMETKKTGIIKYDELIEMIERKFNIKIKSLVLLITSEYRAKHSEKFDLSFEIK